MKPAKVINEKVYRRFQFKNPPAYALGLVTDSVEKKSLIVRNKNGAEITLKPHQLSKELAEFLRATEHTLEYRTVETVRAGKRVIAGRKAKVLPVDHGNYDNGFVIIIKEVNERSWDNSDVVLNFLSSHGVDVQKQCQIVKVEKQGTCMRV
jgi:hypothetical protein